MKIAIGSDHAGFELKEKLRKALGRSGRKSSITDIGTTSTDSVDYPDFAVKVARHVSTKKADFGILVCGSGIGMSVAANKVKGIRAAVCRDEIDAELAREHGDANILCLGGRRTPAKKAIKMAKIFLSTQFEGGRHARRIQKISRLERK